MSSIQAQTASPDWIIIWLTAVAVIATLCGVLLAVAAGYVAYLGYRTKHDLEKEARTAAGKVARKVAAKVAKETAEKYLEDTEFVRQLYAARTKEPEIPDEASASNTAGDEEEEDDDSKL